MKKIIIISIILFSQLNFINANSLGSGSWLMTKTIENNTSEEVYTTFDFLENGKVKMAGIDVGTWAYNAKNKSFKIVSNQFKKLNGTRRVVKINDKKMILEKDGIQWIFEKIDKEKVMKENLSSGFLGAWKIRDENNSDSFQSIIFKSPDSFIMFEKGEGFESKTSGTWMYRKKENSLIVIVPGANIALRGKNKVIRIDEKEMVLQKKGVIYKAVKIVQTAKEIERLNFTEDDFYDENGDYKYDGEEEKLPWQDSYALKENLQKVTQLVYTYKILIKSTQSFDTKILKANVTTDEADESVSVDYIFYGYDNYNLPDDTQLPSNNFDPYSKLYPYKGDTFRVTGTEKISTPAGTFNCTIVELVNTLGEKSKLWMANENPGIIVKIIQDKPGQFGYYHIYELKEIK